MQPLQYFNRYTKMLETEAIWGEAWLRWAYDSYWGERFLWAFIKRAWFSRFYSRYMKTKRSLRRVAPFIRKYRLECADWEKQPSEFTSFNDFFCRRLKPSARPVVQDPGVAVFPADGRHLGYSNVSQMQGFFVKGQYFNLEKLLGSAQRAAPFLNGAVVFSRLCPTDYHRFHFPEAGVPQAPERLRGTLCSVNPIALRQRISILWENRRVFTQIQTERFGRVGMVEVGATLVGTIMQTYKAGEAVERGQEKGFFQFGGSAVITLFEPGRIRLSEDLLAQSEQGCELFAHVGDHLGTALP